MLYYYKKGKNTHTKIHVVCREGAVTDWMSQKWFVKFRAGDFSLDDAPWSGRPVEADKDQKETLIENNQCSTTWEITNILKISKSIKLLVKVKNVSFILQKKPYRLLGQPNIDWESAKCFAWHTGEYKRVKDINSCSLLITH